ncbi:MAG: glycosyltransferase family 2 protein [Aureispira sp.]|nr:glycosyltransferase family 2 protein [Aureispira sp.]
MNLVVISILMPAKNTSNYLAACLDSILAQTYKNWELLVVDDHSTDHSLELLHEYAQQDARIQVFSNQDHGIIAALRLAYSQSKGQFITRMDSDDLMESNKLEQLQAQLEQAGKGYLAIGQVNYFAEGELGQGYKNYAQWLNGLTQEGQNFKEIYKECVIPSPCWMIYREDLESSRAFEPNRYPEDYDLCFRFYAQGLKILPSASILHQWRDYGTRTSRTHEHYANNQFIAIKTHYFKQLDYDPERTLVLWGAGKRAKAIAQALLGLEVPFRWLCNNPKKIGHQIYGLLVEDIMQLNQISRPQVLVSIASPDEQSLVCQELEKMGLIAAQDYFLFC